MFLDPRSGAEVELVDEHDSAPGEYLLSHAGELEWIVGEKSSSRRNFDSDGGGRVARQYFDDPRVKDLLGEEFTDLLDRPALGQQRTSTTKLTDLLVEVRKVISAQSYAGFGQRLTLLRGEYPCPSPPVADISHFQYERHADSPLDSGHSWATDSE
ncbi:hypothetical protein BKM31_04550 [[Actinomadura] parvosata subsp. kistnae]|uniref:Uncharacterized protein n=1 Tax=[Actinomadura] parvosata subsp. kistnae TaxID=1909395 RepID=A0A1U9ZSD3_9ACTN|nr:hypothetical protein BKM31_04550 [Nonomuraea sp. ATCC 55076]